MPAAAGHSGFEIGSRKRHYVKRGKQYLIFNTTDEADAYLVAEAAIEAARKTSRKATRRTIQTFKAFQPEIVKVVATDVLDGLMQRFAVSYDLHRLQKTQDFASLHAIQERLAALQDDEDITLLLLAA